MVSIIILAIAIIPMVGMFDMGLKSATAGSNYDKARALANLKMEEAKSLPFDNAQGQLSEAATPTIQRSGYFQTEQICQDGAPNSRTPCT